MGLFSSIGGAIGGVLGGGGGSSSNAPALGGLFGMGKGLSKYLANAQAAKAQRQAGSVPSVVSTAGASEMSGRINAIENRLYAIENNTGGGSATTTPQPAAVAPAETEAAPIATPDVAGAVAAEVAAGGAVPPAMQDIAPAADALGANFAASPFFMRQRNNPIMFKDQTGDGKITRADVIKARIEGYKK